MCERMCVCECVTRGRDQVQRDCVSCFISMKFRPQYPQYDVSNEHERNSFENSKTVFFSKISKLFLFSKT